MKKIIVKLGKRSYPIIITTKLLNNKNNNVWQLNYGDHVAIITNNNIAKLYLDKLYKNLSQFNLKINTIIIPEGEKYKSITTLNKIFSSLLSNLHNRDTTIIALGGGVIGDLAGFAASSYLRGVKLIQVPTTLLSQIDSAIGGKTAINHFLGKNMIGSFYQPKAVIINLDFLNTLPKKEIYSGLSEIIKYSIIFDNNFFLWIEKNINLLKSLEINALFYCIYHCCELKANIVSIDEYEKKGYRILLNLGHTYGHAIETCMGYGKWSHGQAISAGIMIAAYTSKRLRKINDYDIEKIKKLLIKAELPIKGPLEMSPKDYLKYMIYDKKIISGKLNLILPIKLGKAKIFKKISNEIIIDSINDSIKNN